MRTPFLWCSLCVIAVAVLTQPLLAQQSEAPLWAMGFWKMKLETAPEWRRLVRDAWMRDEAEFKKAGLTEDFAAMAHDYGSEWNLVTFTRFKNYAAIDRFDEQSDQVAKRFSPDTVAGAALNRALRSHILEHYDSFVRPIAGTSLNVSVKPGETPLWVFSFYRLKLGYYQEIESWIKDNWMETDKELQREGVIQDFCYLQHDFGSEYNLIRMVKLKGYGSIDSFEKRVMEIAEKRQPDAKKRQEEARKFSDMVYAHFDSFMRQISPK